MSMSEFYGQPDQQESRVTLELAIERGVNFFDTADVYGQGRNEKLAKKKSCTSAQLALAWVLSQSEDIIPIPGTTKRTHLTSNLQAQDIDISPEELNQLNHLAPPGVAAGERYPEMGMKWINL